MREPYSVGIEKHDAVALACICPVVWPLRRIENRGRGGGRETEEVKRGAQRGEKERDCDILLPNLHLRCARMRET